MQIIKYEKSGSLSVERTEITITDEPADNVSCYDGPVTGREGVEKFTVGADIISEIRALISAHADILGKDELYPWPMVVDGTDSRFEFSDGGRAFSLLCPVLDLVAETYRAEDSPHDDTSEFLGFLKQIAEILRGSGIPEKYLHL